MSVYLEILRPHQWLKNLMLLFPPFLGGVLFPVTSLVEITLPILSFSLGASSIYIVNDLLDISFDSNHPTKRLRPIPAGKIHPKTAIGISVVLAFGALSFGYLISTKFFLFLLGYLIISLSYSWRLKDIPVVELFCVISGFVLRLFAGGETFNVVISDWLFLNVFLLALFLVSGKRLGEVKHSEGQTPEMIRPVLAKYPSHFLSGCMYISGASVLVTYSMYVLSNPILVYTVPLCCFGLLCYLLRVLSGQGGDPTRALLRDPLLLLVGLVWVLLVGWGIYV